MGDYSIGCIRIGEETTYFAKLPKGGEMSGSGPEGVAGIIYAINDELLELHFQKKLSQVRAWLATLETLAKGHERVCISMRGAELVEARISHAWFQTELQTFDNEEDIAFVQLSETNAPSP